MYIVLYALHCTFVLALYEPLHHMVYITVLYVHTYDVFCQHTYNVFCQHTYDAFCQHAWLFPLNTSLYVPSCIHVCTSKPCMYIQAMYVYPSYVCTSKPRMHIQAMYVYLSRRVTEDCLCCNRVLLHTYVCAYIHACFNKIYMHAYINACLNNKHVIMAQHIHASSRHAHIHTCFIKTCTHTYMLYRYTQTTK